MATTPGSTALELPLALDIGATHMRAVRIGAHPSDIRFGRIKTPDAGRFDESLKGLMAVVGADSGSHPAIGLSRAAAVDGHGRIVAWPSRRDWVSVDLLGIIRRATACTGIFDIDDGMAAALWEHAAGDFPRRCAVAVLSIGTGLGVGIVRSGVLEATGDGAATLGHVPIGLPERTCSCGCRGCLQATLADPSVSDDVFSTCLLRARHWLADRFGVDRIVVTGGGVRSRIASCLAIDGVSVSTVPDASAVLGAAFFAKRALDGRDTDLASLVQSDIARALGNWPACGESVA